mgnify:CR=1 FL=1
MPAPPGFVTRIMTNLLSGDFTVDDYRLFDFLRDLKKTEDVEIEPSSCAAFIGPCRLTVYEGTRKYLRTRAWMQANWPTPPRLPGPPAAVWYRKKSGKNI